MNVLVDHRDCAGNGCEGCSWSGTQAVAPVMSVQLILPCNASAFEKVKGSCPCFMGKPRNAAASQCRHIGNSEAQSVCCVEDCPLVACSV